MTIRSVSRSTGFSRIAPPQQAMGAPAAAAGTISSWEAVHGVDVHSQTLPIMS